MAFSSAISKDFLKFVKQLSQQKKIFQWNGFIFGSTTESFRSDSKVVSNIFKQYLCLFPSFLCFFLVFLFVLFVFCFSFCFLVFFVSLFFFLFFFCFFISDMIFQNKWLFYLRQVTWTVTKCLKQNGSYSYFSGWRESYVCALIKENWISELFNINYWNQRFKPL